MKTLTLILLFVISQLKGLSQDVVILFPESCKVPSKNKSTMIISNDSLTMNLIAVGYGAGTLIKRVFLENNEFSLFLAAVQSFCDSIPIESDDRIPASYSVLTRVNNSYMYCKEFYESKEVDMYLNELIKYLSSKLPQESIILNELSWLKQQYQ